MTIYLRRAHIILRLSAVFILGLGFAAPGKTTIQYQVAFDHPERHLFQVTMTIPDVEGAITVRIPAWNALYQIRDFSSHIRQVEAFEGEMKAPIEKLDKQSWHISGNGTITVRYEAYWDEAGPFATQLNIEHAFINPAMILMYADSRRGEATKLYVGPFNAPWEMAGASLADCLVSPSASPRICNATAPSYDALVDAPIEVGKFEKFDIAGISPKVSVVVHGDGWNKRKMEDELKRICEYEIKLMGGAPFEHYTFILHIGKGAGGGGMEHSNSTAIGIPSDEYLSGVAAHEFFHLWNVKRIRPATLEPVDFTKEQYTRALWFAEGVTSTYGSYTLVRSGIWNKDRFYEDLGQQISELETRPAEHWQSAEESSLDAWLEKYALYNGPDSSVSYYTKGQVLGHLLDILIRDRTDNGKSLDDVLRGLNEDFAKQGKYYRDSLDIRLQAEKVGGGSFEPFFRNYVAAAESLPYKETLSLAGLELRAVEHKRAQLGLFAERDASGAIVVRGADADGPAAEAGLRAGDVLLGLNDGELPRNWARWLREQQAGQTVKLKIRRDDKERVIEFKLGEAKETIYQIAEDSHANEKAKRIREGLLHGTTQSATAR